MGEGWSGRRGSNPRPTAWKAVTLPLSYSRLRGSRSLTARRFGAAGPHPRAESSATLTALSTQPAEPEAAFASRWLAEPKRASAMLRRAKAGGEGRTRTFEAARATDLQSAAFDRFATSPIVLY